MATRYQLHGIWASGPTYIVGLMLSLMGERYDYIHVDLRAGEHKRPDYVAKQPFGQVPLLVDTERGQNLSQSSSILTYLAEQTGTFSGASEAERISAREWLFWGWDRLSRGIYRVRGVKLGFAQFSPEIVAHYEAEGKTALQFVDDRLAGRAWIAGETATIADIGLYGILAYAGEAGYDLSAYPNLTAWMGRMEALPGFVGPDTLLPKESRAAA